MNGRFGSRNLVMVLALTAILASSCRVATRITPGQKISIDPCSLVDKAKVEAALGGPVAAPALWLSSEQIREGEDTSSPSCRYEKTGAETMGEYFDIGVEHETKTELSRSGQEVPGLGRASAVSSAPRFGLRISILSDDGVPVWVGFSVAGKDQKALVDGVKPLAREALSTIKKKFPGDDVLKPTPPPINACSLVSDEEVTRLSQSAQGSEGAGFKEETTNPWTGGRWGCWYIPDDAIVIVHVPKNPPAYEAFLKGRGQQVKGLGAKAYWKPPVKDPSFVWGQLYVVAKNGKSFGVDVDRYLGLEYGKDEQGHQDLAVELAKLILTRI
jgi:hypothetical protein